jgi:hypothetical protein
MTLLFVLAAPLIAIAVARWAWWFHLRTLHVLGPALASQVGAAAPASMAQVVSVMVEDDNVLVGLRTSPPPPGQPAPRGHQAPVSTIVVSVRGQGSAAVARLDRWRASGAPVLVWRSGDDDTIEFRQLHTGQHLRVPVLSATTRDVRPAGRDTATA